MNTIATVWLADDDEDDCLVFEDVLAELPHPPKLTCVKNGQILMDELHATAVLPDILFLDLNMPIKDGISVLEDIKRDSRLNVLPVVMLSTSAQPAALDKAFALGARCFVRKPDTFGALKTILEKIFALDLSQAPAHTRHDFFIHQELYL